MELIVWVLVVFRIKVPRLAMQYYEGLFAYFFTSFILCVLPNGVSSV